MANRKSSGKARPIYELIEANQQCHRVDLMCRVLEVARSGYYAWPLKPASNSAKADARLLRLIRASFAASHDVYGAPRAFLHLREAGETCSKHRVPRLMRLNNIRARYGYRTRSHSAAKPSVLIPDLLERNFNVSSPNKAWVTDITYSTPSQRGPPGWGTSCLSMSGMHGSTKLMLQ